MPNNCSLRWMLVLTASIGGVSFIPLSAQNFSIRADQTTLLDIYTPPHDRPVEVFFPISSMPQKPYLHLAYLFAKRDMQGNSTNLVMDLKKQTQAVGGDAVIILDAQSKTEVVYSLESSWTVDVNMLSGLAIIYPESLHFVPGRTKSWEISMPDSTGRAWQVVASLPFDFAGNSGELTGQRKWFEWWHKRHIVSFVGTGAFRREDSYGRLRSLNNPSQRRRMVFSYETPSPQSRIKNIKIYDSDYLSETLHYFYTEDKKSVSHIEIMPANSTGRSFLEYAEYDSEGAVKGYLYLKKEQGKTEQFLRMDYVHYSPEEWDSKVKEIVAAKLVIPK